MRSLSFHMALFATLLQYEPASAQSFLDRAQQYIIQGTSIARSLQQLAPSTPAPDVDRDSQGVQTNQQPAYQQSPQYDNGGATLSYGTRRPQRYHRIPAKPSWEVTYEALAAKCAASELDGDQLFKMMSFMDEINGTRTAIDHCWPQQIKDIIAGAAKDGIQTDGTPTKLLLEQFRQKAIGNGPTVRDTDGNSVPADWVMKGQAPDVAPQIPGEAKPWQRYSLTAVTYTHDGHILDAEELHHVVDRHSLFMRPILNDTGSFLHLEAYYFDGKDQRWDQDNEITANMNLYKIEGNTLCWNGVFQRACYLFRALPGGSYVTVLQQNSRDTEFVLKSLPGDPTGIVDTVKGYLRKNGAIDKERSDQVDAGVKIIGDEVKEEARRSSECSSKGGHMEAGACMIPFGMSNP